MVLLVMCSSTSSCMCPDKDGDGYVVVSGRCRISTGKKAGDCKDNDASIHPGANEIPNNGIDEDCDGADLDTLPPTAEMTHPTDGASSIPIDSSIIIHVKDTGRGVNQSTIVMTIERVAVTPTITGNPSDYSITYGPSDFPHQHQVNVTIAAMDQVGNPMSASFSFMTVSVSGSPWVTADDDGDDIPNGEEDILGTNPDKKTLFVRPKKQNSDGSYIYWEEFIKQLFPDSRPGFANIPAFTEADIEIVVIGCCPNPPCNPPCHPDYPQFDKFDYDPATDNNPAAYENYPHCDILDVVLAMDKNKIGQGVYCSYGANNEGHTHFVANNTTMINGTIQLAPVWSWDTKGFTSNQTTYGYYTPKIFPFPLDNYFTEGAYDSMAIGAQPVVTVCTEGGCGPGRPNRRSPMNLSGEGPDYGPPDDSVEFNQISFDSHGGITSPVIKGDESYQTTVLKRTIVHEMGHALLAGSQSDHCENPQCIMYKATENWEMLDFGTVGCDHKNIIRAGVHNKVH